MTSQRIVIAGGGAAGFFAAIACARARPGCDIRILEKGSRLLTKVLISGGGRCNVTHACDDTREFAACYPRGGRALISALSRFQAEDTVAWFSDHGVQLKTESDGRMFPVTDSSETVVNCLIREAESAGVILSTKLGLESAQRRPEGFALGLSDGTELHCDKLLLTTGGCRTPQAAKIPTSLGHMIVPPVPSLFTFHISTPWVHTLSGLSVEDVAVSVPDMPLRERGPILFTHWGVSGPAILRLSAWGARVLHANNYEFALRINWMPGMDQESLQREFQWQRKNHPSKLVVNSPFPPLPARLWEQLTLSTGIAPETRWNRITREDQTALIGLLMRTEFPVSGKSLNKDEFVTCGGISLKEVDFKTMESRVCPGLYFAGEILDIDGITGGFNFQSAWTTGWIAGHAMAGVETG